MRAIKLETVYPFPPDVVWRAITDKRALSVWLMPNDFQPSVGHKFQFKVKPQRGWRGIVDCEILEVDKPRRLSYSWQGDPRQKPTTVTWILEPVPEGTRLRLEHGGFLGIGGFFLSLILGRGWKRMLRTKLPPVLAHVTDQGYTPVPGEEIKHGCH